MRGVREYTKANCLWQLAVAEPTAATLRALKKDKPDGIIAMLTSEAVEKAARELRVPAVNVSSWCKGVLPRVVPDNQAIGRMAAEHFLSRGFRHFAFAGMAQRLFSQQRQEGFMAALREAGHTSQGISEGAEARVLRSLPKPVGVMACNDLRARQVISSCSKAKVRVPEEVAIVGVDNDETLCELSEVPLSSVDPASRRVGFEAAAVLDRLMDGKPPEHKWTIVPPAGLVIRASSDVMAVPDSEVANAMRYMQVHACDPMRVHDMMDVLKVSRRTLEKRFRTMFGRTLHDEIRRLQFEKARQLLCDTDLKIPQVARKCGFRDPKRFTTLFRQEFGSPPTAFRRDSRGMPLPVIP
jgi:LacI family transcriptional regulator